MHLLHTPAGLLVFKEYKEYIVGKPFSVTYFSLWGTEDFPEIILCRLASEAEFNDKDLSYFTHESNVKPGKLMRGKPCIPLHSFPVLSDADDWIKNSAEKALLAMDSLLEGIEQ